jgi:hypothetical protein
MKDDKLWKIFSEYRRLLDTDQNGNGHCVTCGKPLHWKEGHCGHFISRRHKATKYDEQNTALQCAYCNTYNQGEQFKFAKEIDKRYGKGTADKILIKSRNVSKFGTFEIDQLTKYYKEKLKELKKSKNIS